MMKTTERSDLAAANSRVIGSETGTPVQKPIPVPGDWRGPADDRWWFVGLAALPFALIAMVSTIAISTLLRFGQG